MGVAHGDEDGRARSAVQEGRVVAAKATEEEHAAAADPAERLWTPD